MGFMGRLLALCSLPRTNPRTRVVSSRVRRAPATNSVLLADEVMRHVVDECDLYRMCQSNLIDF